MLKTIDKSVLTAIYEFEEYQLNRLKKEIGGLIAETLKLRQLNCIISIYRWTDSNARSSLKPYDGYSSIIQIDFRDVDGKVIEFDESICSYFEHITFIQFMPIRRKYRIFQNERFDNLQEDIKKFITSVS